MKLTRVGVLSLGCVGGALSFGLIANAALDLMMPLPPKAPQVPVAVAKPAEPVQPATYALASATSVPADFAPVQVKTIPIVYREDSVADVAAAQPANVPLPHVRTNSTP